MIKLQHKLVDTYPEKPPAQSYHKVAKLIRDYGRNSLAFFGLAPENEHFLTVDEAGLVNYRLTHGVAVVPGEPICTPEDFEQVTRRFLNFCTYQHWRVAFYQADSEHLATFHDLKLRIFKLGEEAIIHPQTFTLDCPARANVRTSCRRAEREGVTIHWYEGVPSEEVMEQLEQVSRAWLQYKAGTQIGEETGFSMGHLDELVESAERADTVASISPLSDGLHPTVPRLITAVVTTRSGAACAFVTFTPLYGSLPAEATATGTQPEMQGWGWALDLMRRVPDAPPGVMDLLLVRAIERFRACGAHRVSLGMVALADTRQEMTSVERQLASFLTDRLGLLETRGTLFSFKQKFHPHWESRYLVTNTTLALPKIALAVLRLRNYSGGRLARLTTKLLPF